MPAASTSEGAATRGSDGVKGTIATKSTDELRSLTLSGLKAAIVELPASLQKIAEYQFGCRDEKGQPDHGSGKMIRPVLTLLCARAAGGRVEAAVQAAVTVELVHNFSVLHDDLMDGDVMRRHRRTVWSAFGIADAILLGDALLTLAFRTAMSTGQAGSTMLIDALLDMVRGQATDMALEKRTSGDLSEGLATALGKTGSLLRCACRLGALSAGADESRTASFGDFGEHLGLAFQLVDDLLAIWGDPQVTGKPVDSDLQSRKKSLPVLATLASRTPAADRFSVLYSRDPALPFSLDELAELAFLVEEAGGRAWAERRSLEAYADAAAALERAQPEPGTAAELLTLAAALIKRKY